MLGGKVADLRPADGWCPMTGQVLMCGALMERGWWVLWLCLTRFTTSQKCCCPGINGLKRMRTVVEEAAISHKGTEELFQNVCWFTRALGAGKGAKPIDDHAYGWQWLMYHNNHSVCGFIQSIIKELSAQIFVVWVDRTRLKPMRISGLQWGLIKCIW